MTSMITARVNAEKRMFSWGADMDYLIDTHILLLRQSNMLLLQSGINLGSGHQA